MTRPGWVPRPPGRQRALSLFALAVLIATGYARPLSIAMSPTAEPFNVVEAGIPDLQQALNEGRLTSRQLVVAYLTRIALYEDQLKAIMIVNPHVLEEAEARDRERALGTVRGPLHGIPIALKDNIHTMDMPTTGGAVAFEGYRPPYDATVTRNLRAGGAIIIAKTVLTELANWVAGAPTPLHIKRSPSRKLLWHYRVATHTIMPVSKELPYDDHTTGGPCYA